MLDIMITYQFKILNHRKDNQKNNIQRQKNQLKQYQGRKKITIYGNEWKFWEKLSSKL